MCNIHIQWYASYHRNLVRILPTTDWENRLYIMFFMSICVTLYSDVWQDAAVSSHKTSLWDYDLDQCLYGSYWFTYYVHHNPENSRKSCATRYKVYIEHIVPTLSPGFNAINYFHLFQQSYTRGKFMRYTNRNLHWYQQRFIITTQTRRNHMWNFVSLPWISKHYQLRPIFVYKIIGDRICNSSPIGNRRKRNFLYSGHYR